MALDFLFVSLLLSVVWRPKCKTILKKLNDFIFTYLKIFHRKSWILLYELCKGQSATRSPFDGAPTRQLQKTYRCFTIWTCWALFVLIRPVYPCKNHGEYYTERTSFFRYFTFFRLVSCEESEKKTLQNFLYLLYDFSR